MKKSPGLGPKASQMGSQMGSKDGSISYIRDANAALDAQPGVMYQGKGRGQPTESTQGVA
jgi:hypothetical protein